jgi:hypothetical protein
MFCDMGRGLVTQLLIAAPMSTHEAERDTINCILNVKKEGRVPRAVRNCSPDQKLSLTVSESSYRPLESITSQLNPLHTEQRSL